MLSSQIRTRFLEYFQAHGHLLVPSASLVPRDDPSLLLINAGMAPFKAFFTGARQPPAERLTSCQKAFRTVDIEDVGDSQHDTLFEMLGNFSFGSYFKEEAIGFAFELLTAGFGLAPDRLQVSVHPSDQESERLWGRLAGISGSRVVRLDDNFWQAGPTGPFGVDSEIYYDLGADQAAGPDDRPGQGTRFLEVWNLVFMDSERLADGSAVPLARPGVDTGMGLERIAMVLQGVSSIFETDLFAPVLANFEERSGGGGGALPAEQRLRHLRILADHTRAACCLIADGVLPSNEGRGYVLRRVLRRALVSARQLEVEGGLASGARAVVGVLGGQYPELESSQGSIVEVLEQESERFQEALERGMIHFEATAAGGRISGEDAFRLHDTYGFPYELTQELAAARGLELDAARFEELLEEQRTRAREGRTGMAGALRTALPESRFRGYETLELETTVAAILRDSEPVERTESGQQVEVVLSDNPFYAQGGGQVGDRGELVWNGGRAQVLDSQASAPGQGIQLCLLQEGALELGQTVTAKVDQEWRRGCRAHHSATHLLNRSLRRQLGASVVQRGSFVGPDHATFDFSWAEAIPDETLAEIEREVNRAVRADLPHRVDLLPLAQARQTGALTLPDETYAETVRVVSFGDFSKELCGGTHVASTGEIGAVVLTGSRSVGQGVRRVEFLAGEASVAWWEQQRARLAEVAQLVRSPAADVVERVRSIQERARGLERELRQARRPGAANADGATRLEQVGGVPVAVEDTVSSLARKELRQHADHLLAEAPGGAAVVLAGDQLLMRLSEALSERGPDAGRMAAAVCRDLGGRGGGNPRLGQGDIPAESHPAALAAVLTILGSALEEA